MKNMLAENLLRFNPKNLSNIQKQTALRLNEQTWPRWTPAAETNYRAIAGSVDNNGYFAAAGVLFDELKTELESSGWTPAQSPATQTMDWNTWQTRHPGLMKQVEQFKTEGEEGPYRYWAQNVLPNVKTGTWESADKKQTIHASTWDSFDDWVESGKPGLALRVCSTAASNYKSCSARPIMYNGGQVVLK